MAAAAPRQRTVLTIGHSTRELDEVVEMLRSNKVDELVDVRSYPSSRKFPQWNREAIAANLPDDIGYRWERRLGGRRHTPAGVPSVNGHWRVKAFRDYADYMASQEFTDGLQKLVHLAGTARPAIMCSEAVPWRCHRWLITDALIVAGIQVDHIMGPTSTRPAEVNERLVAHDGHLTYPGVEPTHRDA